MSRADWAVSALDLSADIKRAGDYLPIGRVCDMTSMADATIMDSLTRRQVVGRDPISALCRPKARIGTVPLWSREQVDDYLRLKQAQDDRFAEAPELPKYDPATAAAAGLVSTGEQARRLDLHEMTVRRFQRVDDTFPPAVGDCTPPGRAGRRNQLRRWKDILAWAEKAGRVVPYPDLADELGEYFFETLPEIADEVWQGGNGRVITTRLLARNVGLTVERLGELRQRHADFPETTGRVRLSEGWRTVYPTVKATRWVKQAIRAAVD